MPDPTPLGAPMHRDPEIIKRDLEIAQLKLRLCNQALTLAHLNTLVANYQGPEVEKQVREYQAELADVQMTPAT